MALKKHPGGVLYETDGGAWLNEEAGVNLEAIHRQIIAGVGNQVQDATADAVAAAKVEADRAASEAAKAAGALTTKRDVEPKRIDGVHLDTLDTPGHYVMPVSAGASLDLGYPVATAGAIEVTATSTRNIVWQKFTPWATADGAQGREYRRQRYGGVWKAWLSVEAGAAPTPTRIGTADLDTMTTTGTYTQAASGQATDARHYPSPIAGTLSVVATPDSAIIWQTYTPWASATDGQSAQYRRQRYNGVWKPWVSTDPYAAARAVLAANGGGGGGSTPSSSGGHSREMRMSELRVRVGQPRVKGGAVAIIADHGSVQFREYMLPHLRAHGLRCSLAMIGTRLDPSFKWYDTEAGVTWEEIAGWATTDGLEITNHSLTHGDASTGEGVYSEIVGGLNALREALPGIPIDTWSQVGVSATGYAGFGTGQVLSSYWETTAGRLILDHHTLATGSAPMKSAHGPNIFPLDGHPKLGVNGRWIDTGVTSSVTQMIDTAVAQHMGCIVRIHPQFIGQPGYITPDALAAFLASLAARRDAGELDVLTFRELNLAVRA